VANIASSKKDVRRSQRRAVANRAVRSAVKTRVTKARRAIGEGASEQIVQLGAEAVSSLDRAASKGVLHRNNAARRKSRLIKRLNVAASAPEAAAEAKPAGKGVRGSRAKAAAPATTAAREAKATRTRRGSKSSEHA
jgi:small subunit ribosomal protein S20